MAILGLIAFGNTELMAQESDSMDSVSTEMAADTTGTENDTAAAAVVEEETTEAAAPAVATTEEVIEEDKNYSTSF